MRLIIWGVTYLLIVFVLPRWAPVIDAIERTDGIALQVRFQLCAGGALLGLIILALARKHAPYSILRVVFYFGFGLFCAGAWGVFEYVSDQFPRLEYLVVFPLGFALAEGFVILYKRWRGIIPELSEDESSGKAQTRLMLRVIIYPIVYGVIVFILPYQTDLARLLAPLGQIHPTITFWSHIGAIALGAVMLIAPAFVTDDPFGDTDDPDAMYGHWRMQLVLALALGTIIAGLYGLFYRVLGGGLSFEHLLLIPIGFAIAEGIYLLVAYRIEHGPYER